MTSPTFDTVVVGGGLGGLLAAALCSQRGQRVLLLERFPHVGGRFTAIRHHECEISTGALHYIPHGDRGHLASLLRDLNVPLSVVRPSVIASFHDGQRHVMWKRKLDIARLPSALGAMQLGRIVVALKRHRSVSGDPSFGDWLRGKTRDPVVNLIFERFVEFALSVTVDDIPYSEMRAVFKSVARYGLPAVPQGGCRAVVESLADKIRQTGGIIELNSQVEQIHASEQGVVGVLVRDRQGHHSYKILTRRVISDIGPVATRATLDARFAARLRIPEGPPAEGLKLQVLTRTSLVPHSGIMFCLGTKRISGLVEVTRAIPEAAPRGYHFLNTFQVLKTDDLSLEKKLAIDDLASLTGTPPTTFEVVHSGIYRKSWPVNHCRQGWDCSDQQPIRGLFMVGDAYKPSGLMMVEGVAASVEAVQTQLNALLKTDSRARAE